MRDNRQSRLQGQTTVHIRSSLQLQCEASLSQCASQQCTTQEYMPTVACGLLCLTRNVRQHRCSACSMYGTEAARSAAEICNSVANLARTPHPAELDTMKVFNAECGTHCFILL
jgi:hypothetical protein